MSKTYKLIDLLSEIELDKIEENTKFKISDSYNLFRPQIATYKNRKLNIEEENIFNCYDVDYLLHADFELIEEDTIDIESIEELELVGTNFIDMDKNELKDNINKNRINLNELVQAIKQLNKEIKSIKEN